MGKKKTDMILYQAKNGKIEFRGDFDTETIWGSLNQIASLFNRDKSVISRHIRNIYKSGELDRKSTVAKIATVQNEGGREILRDIKYYNLDMVLSVGYRVDSKQATQFRIWATKTLKQHLTQGYTINKKQIANNYDAFMKAVAKVQDILPTKLSGDPAMVIDLIKEFAGTWMALSAYDKGELKAIKPTKKSVQLAGDELFQAIKSLRAELIKKGEATELFGQEKKGGNVEGIVGNVMQTFDGKQVYATVEEKAAHLLYFMIKNHPFTDGNKRSGAFAFVWFLRKAKVHGMYRINPSALTAITVLIAESDPKKKDQVVSLVMMLLTLS